MNWEINHEPEEEKPLPPYEIVVADGVIDDVGTMAGDLVLVERYYLVDARWKRKYIPQHQIEMYQKMVKTYGIGTIVPYTLIRELFADWPHLTVAYRLTYLWANHYLEKYARGKWGLYNGNWKEGNWRRGRFHGVHYKILEKKSDE